MEYQLARDYMFSRRKITKKWVTSDIHYHEEYELYYMLDGSTTYFIGDDIYSIEKGNFVFIPKGIPHKTDNGNCRYNERILLSFSGDIFNEKTKNLLEQLSRKRIIYVPDAYLPQLEEILFKLEAEYIQEEHEKSILLDIYILELLALLCRYQCERKAHIHESDKIVYQISEYISANYAQDITLESLCKVFAISEAYLSRKFKAVSGIGINQYITYVRISNAEQFLRDSDLSVTEIAEQCGFNGSNYFSAVFKKIKGVPPLKYRQHHVK